jgi:purine-binding chemotaxis protein CheW
MTGSPGSTEISTEMPDTRDAPVTLTETGEPEGAAAATAGAVQRILLDRARRLAQQDDAGTARDGETAMAVLLCAVGSERYGIELRSLEAVRPAAGLVPVPCTPPFVAGVLNLRGEILTVLDLAAALGVSGATSTTGELAAAGAAAAPGFVLLVTVYPGGGDGAAAPGGPGPARVGLLVDEVLDVQTVFAADLAPPLSGMEYARGVAGGATVLDVERLLADGRFEVSEDVA